MRPLFYMLLVPGREGEYEFAGAYQNRETAEAKASELEGECRIEAATRQDLEGADYV